MKYFKLKKRIKELERMNDNLSWSNFKLVKENKEVNKEIKYLKEPKAILNIDITPEELAKQIVKKLNEEKNHKCTPKCFGEHVIKVIQDDYTYRPKVDKAKFIKYWYEKLSKEYPWLECLYIIDEKIYFKSKESSI